MKRSYWWEVCAFLLLAGLISYQLFLPPVTGLANNFDFAKVLAPFSYCPADHDDQNNIYLVTRYVFDEYCKGDDGLISIEAPLFVAAQRVSALFTGPKTFDLRALGAVHLAILLLGFGVLLFQTRLAMPEIRYGIPILFIAIFTDVAYTCYLNSVYMDAPAFVLLVASSAIAVAACFHHQPRLVSVSYLIFAAALTFSKTQHAVLGIAFAAIAAVIALRPAECIVRIEWTVVAVLLLGCVVTMFALTPASYLIYPLYDVIFGRLAPHSADPWGVMKELGLGDEDLKYLDTHAYMPTSPVYNKVWAERFLQRTSFGKVAAYYLHHPDVALREVHTELTHSAPVLRPADMANFRKEDGYPPRTLATRFSLWSNLRGGTLRVFPYLLPLILLAPWLGLLPAFRTSPLLPLALALSAAGVVEFTMSSLTDALDNARHLFVFQVIAELVILLLVAAALQAFQRKPREL